MKKLISRILTVILLTMTSCQIEPHLRLATAQQDIIMEIPLVVTDMDVIWDTTTDWRAEWFYGWDADDERLWGKLEYPTPSNFEVRRYFLGEQPQAPFIRYDAFTAFGNRFRRRYDFGYYDLLIWSNIDSPDGTQTLIIDESNASNIIATTSRTRDPNVPSVFNQPEPFYSFLLKDLNISTRREDYDYFDEAENLWVKHIHADLIPLVYIYLVQVILHNNEGRVTGIGDHVSISGMADAVSLHTGETSSQDADVACDLRLKCDLDVKGETCDILGGKFASFGLCQMPAWSRNRSRSVVTRTDIENQLTAILLFRNGKEGRATFDITEQVRQHPRGGVLTIHVDVNDLDIPASSGGSGFDPTVDDYEEVEHEFSIK